MLQTAGEMFASDHIKTGRKSFGIFSECTKTLRNKNNTFFLEYLGTSPEFSRSCLSPLMESTLVGFGFMGSVVTVLMKFLLVTMPMSGGAVLSGTGGFLSVQVRLTFVESSLPRIDKIWYMWVTQTAIKTWTCMSHSFLLDALTFREFWLFRTLLQIIVWWWQLDFCWPHGPHCLLIQFCFQDDLWPVLGHIP